MKIFDTLAKQLVSLIGNVSDLLELITKWPFRRSGGNANQSIWMYPVRLILLPVALFSFLLNLPLQFYRNSNLDRKKDLLWGLPAITVFGLVILTFLYTTFFANSIDLRYRTLAQQSMNRGEFELAKTVYGRLVTGKKKPEKEDLLGWAIVLNSMRDYERSLAVLNKLAPDDVVGYPPAHKLKAVVMASTVGPGQRVDLKMLEFHLKNASDQNSEEMNQAWSIYHNEMGNFGEAAKRMSTAAETNPGLLLAAAKLHERAGNKRVRDNELAKARTHFDRLTKDAPLEFGNQVALTRVLIEQREFDLAEATIRRAFERQSKEEYRPALADFYIAVYDAKLLLEKESNSEEDEEDFETKIRYLSLSLLFEPNRVLAYDRITKLYESCADDPEKKMQIKDMLLEMITKGKSAALAHLLLGNFLWSDGDKETARKHLELSYELNSNFLVILNNLAWSLAMSEPRDLDRALGLANLVVENEPTNASFRDTLANILKLLGMADGEVDEALLKEALLEFQKTLNSAHAGMNLIPIHVNMAEIYRTLGQDDMARRHTEQATKLQNGTKNQGTTKTTQTGSAKKQPNSSKKR